MLRRTMVSALGGLPFALAGRARAADAHELKIGIVYSGSGPYASISMPVFSGLKLWIAQQNAEGGAVEVAWEELSTIIYLVCALTVLPVKRSSPGVRPGDRGTTTRSGHPPWTGSARTRPGGSGRRDGAPP